MIKINQELKEHIDSIPMVDTHNHLKTEKEWIETGPGDVLADLLANYSSEDLVSARCDSNSLKQAATDTEGNISQRWKAIEKSWKHMQFTGYGEAVRLQAKNIYGIEEITADALESAQPILDKLRKPGERYRLLKDVAGLDHIQSDRYIWTVNPDRSGNDFFLQDISWWTFCNGHMDMQKLLDERGESDIEIHFDNLDDIYRVTGIEVTSLKSYKNAMETIFERYGKTAIAVKAQHAYNRTLAWKPRPDAEAEAVLQKLLKKKPLTIEEHIVLGDWAWARGIELAGEYGLPFKIHTGYYAGNNYMITSRVNSGNLCELLINYPQNRFILMHISYPYFDELLAVAKHFQNVYVDLCWAWTANPLATSEFFRKFLHAVPINKLFAFGGDTFWPTSTLAYSLQARKWIAYTLSEEIEGGYISLEQAKRIALQIMRDNQYECFDIEGTHNSLNAAKKEDDN